MFFDVPPNILREIGDNLFEAGEREAEREGVLGRLMGVNVRNSSLDVPYHPDLDKLLKARRV